MASSVVNVLLILTVAAVGVALIFYRLAFSERTVFKGRMRLLQFLSGIVLPPIILIPVFQLYRMIERNPFLPVVPLSDDAFLFIIFTLITLASVGNGMHVAGVSIDYPAQNLDSLDEEEKAVLHVIEFFHHGFSHLMVQLPMTMMTFVFFLFELNHQSPSYLTGLQFWLVFGGGLVYGVASALAAIEGASGRLILTLYLFLIVAVLLLITKLQLSFLLLPAGLYYLVSYLAGLAFLALWRAYHGGFPEIMGELKVKEGHPQSPRRLGPKKSTLSV